MENSKGFPKEFRFSCVHCGTCCTDKNTLVNVTYSDILRIKKGLNLSLDETLEILGFYIFEKKPSIEELKKMVVPPIETEKGLAFEESLPIIALFLADRGEYERAVELFALATAVNANVANSRWHEDIAGNHMAAIAATLPRRWWLQRRRGVRHGISTPRPGSCWLS